MRRIFIAACIASGFTLSTLSGTAVTNKEWTELLRTSRCAEDLIVLTNGSKLCGKITELPPLTFTFGTISFRPDEIAAIGIISRDSQPKVQYMTYDGQNFIGSLNGKRFVITYRDIHEDPQHDVQKEIDGSEISFILLAKPTNIHIVKSRSLFHIQLQNGDHISARIESARLHLTDGKNDSTLDPQNIVEVCFNGGLQGRVLSQGKPQDLGYRFVKEPTLSLQIPRKDLLVRLPWKSIDTIQAANQTDEWPVDIYVPPTHHTVSAEASKPSAIGNTFGSLLTAAAGAISVHPQSFATIDDSDHDPVDTSQPLDEPPALFSEVEVDEWGLNIAFNDDPDPQLDDSEDDDTMANMVFEYPHSHPHPQLFDHSEEANWELAIAFEDGPTGDSVSTEDLALLDERELNDLYNRLDLHAEAEAEAEAEPEKAVEPPQEQDDADEELQQNLADQQQESDLIEALEAEAEAEPEKAVEPPQEQDDADEELQQNLADQQQESDLIEALEDESVDEDRVFDGFYIEEDFIILPSNARDHSAYQATLIPTAPEPVLYVRMPAYYIDETPVTNRQYARFVQETGHNPPRNWEGTQPPAGLENEPVSFVAFDDAAAYAAWAGRRLPNEMEWLLALEKGLIIDDPSYNEWTSTASPDKKKVIVSEKGTLETLSTQIDRKLTFRTVQQ